MTTCFDEDEIRDSDAPHRNEILKMRYAECEKHDTYQNEHKDNTMQMK